MNALAKATEKTGYTIASDAVDSNKDKTSARMHIALEGKNVLKLILKSHGKGVQSMFGPNLAIGSFAVNFLNCLSVIALRTRAPVRLDTLLLI